MKDVIFYGCGNWLLDNWDGLCKEYNPICICDKNKSKHGTELKGVEIISLESSIIRYPQADYYVTLSGGKGFKYQAMDSLINEYGIGKERIVNYEEYYYGYGCPLLQRALIFQHNRIQNCCENMIFSSVPYADYNAGDNANEIYVMKKKAHDEIRKMDFIEGRLDNETSLFEMRGDQWAYNPKKKTENASVGASLHCLHCETPEKWWWPKDSFVIDYIQVTANSDSFCNFKCSYCCEGMQEYMPESEDDVADRIVEVIKEVKESKGKLRMADSVRFAIASGEPALYRGLEKVISETPDAYFEILTNASVYSEVIQNLISNNHGEILVSLDAGTEETFAKVKGLNMFAKVKENIKKYQQYGKVLLKYIILPEINDNIDDVDGFLAICKDINPIKVYIARDCIYGYDINSVQYEEKTVTVLKKLMRELEMMDIRYELLYYPESFKEELY